MENNWRVISNKLLQALLLIYLLIGLYSLVGYLLSSEVYQFGTEVAGWRYNSPAHYIGSLLLELLLVAGALGIGFSKLKVSSLLWLRGIVLVLIATQWFF